MHRNYEELCALAVTGQITGDAMKVLDQHGRNCDSCRRFLEDLSGLETNVTPVVAGARMAPQRPPDGIRERFWQRAAGAGITLYPGHPIAEVAAEVASFKRTPGKVTSETRLPGIPGAALFLLLPRFARMAAAAMLFVGIGFIWARHDYLAQVSPKSVLTPLADAPSAKPVDPAATSLAKPDFDDGKRLAFLSAELSRAQFQKRQVEESVTALKLLDAAEAQQLRQEFAEQSEKLIGLSDRNIKLQAALDSERNNLATAEAISGAQQKATEEAQGRLASLQSELERSQHSSAAQLLGADLISSRNLHIVDVYDSESNGGRQHAFGRVFFVEGKSLVFYAYDLAGSKAKNKTMQFKVWGEQAGTTSVSINLGVMHKDDPGQSPWVLTCSDPKVLSRINAVFISPDGDSKSGANPPKAKLMYAFLGSPNHP